MEGINLDGLIELDQRLGKVLEEIPEMQRDLHEELAEMAKREVDTAIARSGVKDSSGNVRRYQIKAVGSGGGYAAVRPEKFGGGDWAKSPAGITRFLNSGHAIRMPKGGKNYQPRIRVMRVRAFAFYEAARIRAEALAIKAANEMLEEIAERIG